MLLGLIGGLRCWSGRRLLSMGICAVGMGVDG